ncbi:MAG: hypothetical protein NVS9B4_10860 [Candidatus Acidiferrum sp.]
MPEEIPRNSRIPPIESPSISSGTDAPPFGASDVLGILCERGWLSADSIVSQELTAWCARAAALLGSHAVDREELAGLLELIFHYDAHESMEKVTTHVALSRYGARDVLRQTALLLLDGRPLTSDRFKEIIATLKEGLHLSGPELFHPIRLALAGRAGEGKLDRVILLLDEAAELPFAVPVKSARARVIEFCAALD